MNKETVIKVIAEITILILVVVLAVAHYKIDKSLYNNGYCTCDNRFRLLNVSDHKYYFVCDKCGNTFYTSYSPSWLKED